MIMLMQHTKTLHFLSYRLTIFFFLSFLLPLSTTSSRRFARQNQKVPVAFNQCLHGSLKKEQQWDKLLTIINVLKTLIKLQLCTYQRQIHTYVVVFFVFGILIFFETCLTIMLRGPKCKSSTCSNSICNLL